MLARSLKTLVPLALLGLAGAPTASARTIDWSGQTWDVRAAGFGGPGPNHWSASEDNVRLDGSTLVLSIVKDASGNWTSAELDAQRHLGYGTYRWVVETDLSKLDSHEVLGMFTYGGSSPSNNEIDIEPSHWGNLDWATGSATMWLDATLGRSQAQSFSYSDRPPYINQFTWSPGSIHYLVTDATGARLFDWTVTDGVPVPSTEVPVTNYWRYQGVAPAGARSMRIASFDFYPPGSEPPAPAAPATPSAPAMVGQRGSPATSSDAPTAAPVKVRLGMRAGRSIAWRSTGAARLRLTVTRRSGRRPVTLGTVARTVRAGRGRLRLPARIGGHRLRRGAYGLAIGSPDAGVRLTPSRLRFRIAR